MSEMTRKIAIYCLKAYSEHHNEMCEECEIYGQTGEDHCFEDALEFAINSLETDETYQLEYEITTGQTKVVTTKQLEEMYAKYEKKLWSQREDVRGDDMIEIGYAEQFMQDLLMELGCWDDEVEDETNN